MARGDDGDSPSGSYPGAGGKKEQTPSQLLLEAGWVMEGRRKGPVLGRARRWLSPNPSHPDSPSPADGERCWDLSPAPHHHQFSHPWSLSAEPDPAAPGAAPGAKAVPVLPPRRVGAGGPPSSGTAQLSRSLLVRKLHIVLRHIFCFFTCEIFLSEPVNVQISSGGLSYVF